MNLIPRIAILADFPWSFFDDGATGRGGGQSCTWLVQIAEEFARDCPFELHWVSFSRTGAFGPTRHRQWGGQHFHQLQSIKRSIDLRLGFMPARWQLLRILAHLDVDLVHCWGSETPYPVVCGRGKWPTLLSMQGILTEYARIGSLPDIFYWRELARREPYYLKNATMISCESQWGMDRVRDVVSSVDVRQVEYGVNPSFYQTAWQPDTVHPYALFSGSIDTRKGVDVLIEAWKLVSIEGASLRIAGDGALSSELKNMNVPGIEWLGMLSWQEIQKQLAGATCLVLPTWADTSPNVVKEARVVGLPVITTLHGGQAGYIKDGENGIIVEPLEPIELAQALSRLLSNPELARQMGATRHAEDRAYFKPLNTAKGFLTLYKELLDSELGPKVRPGAG